MTKKNQNLETLTCVECGVEFKRDKTKMVFEYGFCNSCQTKENYSLVKTLKNGIKVLRAERISDSEADERNFDLASQGKTLHWEKLVN